MNEIKLKKSIVKALPVIFLAIFLAVVGVFNLLGTFRELCLFDIFGGLFLCSLGMWFFYVIGKLILPPYSIGTFDKKGYYDSRFNLFIPWNDLEISIKVATKASVIGIKILKFTDYSKSLTDKQIVECKKNYKNIGGHIQLHFPFTNYSFSETLKMLEQIKPNMK